MIKTLKEHPEAKICAIVHAETSTGIRQPLEDIGAYCKKTGTLFLVDAVTSLGGCEVKVDQWGIDICYSCTQKGISVPPGLSPITVSSKARRLRSARRRFRAGTLTYRFSRNTGERREPTTIPRLPPCFMP
jgi:alanine-glyoxylate transaminase/serine-glyoxylate transaminase/serine-pyruvate transaminase